MPNWISCGSSAYSRSKPSREAGHVLARQAGDQVDVHVRVEFSTSQRMFSAALSLFCLRLTSALHLGIEALDADLELQRAGRELRDARP